MVSTLLFVILVAVAWSGLDVIEEAFKGHTTSPPPASVPGAKKPVLNSLNNAYTSLWAGLTHYCLLVGV